MPGCIRSCTKCCIGHLESRLPPPQPAWPAAASRPLRTLSSKCGSVSHIQCDWVDLLVQIMIDVSGCTLQTMTPASCPCDPITAQCAFRCHLCCSFCSTLWRLHTVQPGLLSPRRVWQSATGCASSWVGCEIWRILCIGPASKLPAQWTA